jgi:hypothetical protein
LKGVIVDTSYDFNSPTYDFLSGVGINLPNPTNEEYAHRLFVIAHRLWYSGALSYVIGNSRIQDEYHLGPAMKEFLPQRFGELKNARAVELKRLNSEAGGFHYENGVCTRIYLGYSRDGILWFSTTEWDWDWRKPDSKKGPLSCVELDVDSLAELFSTVDWATPFPHHLLDYLLDLVRQERAERKRKFLLIDKQLSLLEHDAKLFATSILQRRSSGIEG